MDFASNAVETKVLNFLDLGIPDVNTSDKFNTFGTPDNIIRRLTDGTHWSVSDHIFGGASAVVMSATRSELEYSYKTDFQN